MQDKPDGRRPTSIRLWSLREDVVVETASDRDALVLVTRWGEIELREPSPTVRDGLARMSLGPVSLLNLTGADQVELAGMLDRLRGCVVHSLSLDDRTGPLLSVVPISEEASFTLPRVAGTDLVRLSRFTAMRTNENELVLESPLATHRAVLHRALPGGVAGALGRAVGVSELAAALNADVGVVTDIVAYLIAAEMVVLGDRDSRMAPAGFAEDLDPRLAQWSHHDLLFHGRSRLGRHDEPLGAAYRHVGQIAPLPAVKPMPDGQRFPLYRPEVDELAASDPPLTEVVERRRSFREFAEQPLSARQIGELLFRTARIRSLMEATGAGGVRYTVSDRPYPSSDSLYELELYLTIDDCDGLPRGIYHYDPLDHALMLINTKEPHVAELLDGAKALTGTVRRPPVLITITARMARLSWVYDGIAYATALKHVGVLQQTLYLAATAMGLAPCALATGDSETTTEALRLDWPAEVSVGEFAIGQRAGDELTADRDQPAT